MTWDARQRGMLAAMGLRVWREPAAQAVPGPAQPAPVPLASPAAPAAPAAPVVQAPLCEANPAGHIPHLAHWMVVGEPQSALEAASELAFGGDAGRLLDNMLRAIGLSRDAGDGSSPASKAFLIHAQKPSLPADGLPACAPYLQQQIAQVKPQIILAMGTFAVQAVLGSTEPVGKLRGRVHRCQGLPVIVTYDPAYLLRSPADKAGAWVDLCLARDTLARAADLP